MLRRTKPVVVQWEESPAQWSIMMMDAVGAVNDASTDVDGLCRQFPERVEACFAEKGARQSY